VFAELLGVDARPLRLSAGSPRKRMESLSSAHCKDLQAEVLIFDFTSEKKFNVKTI
jgi:hypothetical protein